jgi:hypothetical protein
MEWMEFGIFCCLLFRTSLFPHQEFDFFSGCLGFNAGQKALTVAAGVDTFEIVGVVSRSAEIGWPAVGKRNGCNPIKAELAGRRRNWSAEDAAGSGGRRRGGSPGRLADDAAASQG